MKNFVIRLFVNALALAVAAWLVDGIQMSGDFFDVLVVALVFGILNAILKPLLLIFSLPLLIVTLGLFLWVINALMLKLTAWIAGVFGIGFHVHGFWTALLGALIITIVNFFVDRVLVDDKPSRRWSGGRSTFSSRRF